MEKFTKIFLSYIKSDHHVLDLGAGPGEYSQMFVDKGARVTAVDPKLPDSLGQDIIAKKLKIEDFIAEDTGQYDLVFMRNILQFLDKQFVADVLIPWFDEHVAFDGIIGIETFYQEPEPPFERSMVSLYTSSDLSNYFMNWQELYSKQYDHHGPDMKGTTRHFFISDLIVTKI